MAYCASTLFEFAVTVTQSVLPPELNCANGERAGSLCVLNN